jgi:hypothetical protein
MSSKAYFTSVQFPDMTQRNDELALQNLSRGEIDDQRVAAPCQRGQYGADVNQPQLEIVADGEDH